jgi:L-alanine-DL-glutamate epimerase-like enolase superfamily enzyme
MDERNVSNFKIKVHGDEDEDVARVAAIREEVGPDAGLTIDANQSYRPKDAIRAIRRMAEFRIDLAEQPVAAGDLRGLKLVTDSVPVTVEADEAADSLEQVATLVRERIVDAVSLKITKLGGLRNTIAAARICEAGGIRYRLGAHVGSQLLAASAVHLATALPGIWYTSELTEYDRLLEDPFEGLEIREGLLQLPTVPGCGVNPRADSALLKAAS